MAKVHYTAIALLALAGFVLQLLIAGVDVSWLWMKAVSASLAIVGAGIFVFDYYVWRVGWLYGKFHHRPNLRGTWDVTFQSNFDDGSGQRAARVGTMRIDQTFFSLSAFVETAESEGHIVAREFVGLGKGQQRLIATYRNEPRASVRGRSPMHYGTMMLNCDLPHSRPKTLRGNYWTDRETTGEMEATRRAL